MTRRRGTLSAEARFFAVLALATCIGFAAKSTWAAVQFESDGAVQNATNGGWDLPTQGTCFTNGLGTITTRPECLGLRFPAYTSSSTCQAVGTSPNNLAWTTSVCDDPAHDGDQAGCEAIPGRLYSNGKCAVTMKDMDRNVATCTGLGGTWVTSGKCTGRWNAPANTGLLLGSTGSGDQCLRCHNATTQYNSVAARWVGESFLKTGHKNMARKVSATHPWGGPPFSCSNPLYTDEMACEDNGATWVPTIYPSDDGGNAIDWTAGTIHVGSTDYGLYWIYGDWLGPLPRAIYNNPAGMSYSCGRCHNTGWTSDATLQSTKEPEASFPGVTWDGTGTIGSGQVNLASGVSGDANKMASWDLFGIVCSRCHGSAVENTSHGGVPPFTAAAGMTTHDNALGAADNNSGVCSNPRYVAQADCEMVRTLAEGPMVPQGIWLTTCSKANNPAVCSNSAATSAACAALSPAGTWVSAAGWCSNNTSYKTQTDCTNNGFTWQTGVCTRPGYDSTTCTGSVGSWRTNGRMEACLADGGTWTYSSCSIPAICSKPGYTTYAACTGASGTWTSATSAATCEDAGGTYTGNNSQRGQIVTSLCIQCHRQETAGIPYADSGSGAGSLTTSHPGQYIKVGPYHNTVAFPSHPHGNMFLNSPHGQFTGTFDKVATGKFNFAGTGEYKSFFENDGEPAGTGNGCTGCHNVHKSTVEGVGAEGAVKECTECHAKNLAKIKHPLGTGTPLENVTTDPASACETCHMPGGIHMFRINADPSYSTFPAAALTGVTNANTAPDGDFTAAVWVDIDLACGQCHGGGNGHAATKGAINASSASLNVSAGTGNSFAAGDRILIAGAASVAGQPADFETYVASVSGDTLTLVGKAATAVSNADVTQNPTKNGAGYMTKTELAGYAEGIHNDAPAVTFSYTLGNPNTLMVTVFAAATCNGSCNAYAWDWGDGNTGSGATTSHTYATGGAKLITLTVTQYGVGSATAQKIVNVATPDSGPTVGGTACGSILADDWSAEIIDSSTDDNLVSKVTVVWGDGSLLAMGGPGATFDHTYRGPGTYKIVQKALDNIGQQSVRTCYVTVSYFTIGGSVFESNGTTGVASAKVTVTDSTTHAVVKTAYTAGDGSYSAGSLRPGTYDLTATASGFTFPVISGVTVGPSLTGQDFTAN